MDEKMFGMIHKYWEIVNKWEEKSKELCSPASEKQMSFAKSIAWTLACNEEGEELPEIPTKRNLWKWINRNLPKYSKIKEKERRRDWEFNRIYGLHKKEKCCCLHEYMNSDDITDCFDYGIAPWGNS